jgi:[acyl-carrier-protein] S-malonyltransferase
MTNLVALFPGQGSQHVGMGKDLVANFRVARDVFDEASEAIHVDLKKLCFDGPESELVLTENTQPALLVSSVAAFRVAAAEHGVTPDAVAGHSLGEYSALVAAGAIELARATSWVRARGRAMQQAVPPGQGTMAAVLGMEEEPVNRLCALATERAAAKRPGATTKLDVDAVVEPANFNAPGQIVIAGSVDAVAEAIAILKSGEISGKAIPLSVSAPFHCRLMKPARERMAGIFAEAPRPQALACSYVANRTARLSREPGVIHELLVEQIDHPVLWSQSMTGLLQSGAKSFIEFGPGRVLAGLLKRIAQPLSIEFRAAGCADAAGVSALSAFLKG